MPDPTFAESVLSWRDFYVGVAEATAALLGLLFVGVSIRLSATAAEQRPEQRGRAALAFGNLVAALILAFILLIPDQDARSVAIQIGVVTVASSIRLVRRSRALVLAWPRLRAPFATVRRLGWTAVAIVVLAYAAIGLWVDGSAGYLYALLAAVFIFLIGAADVSWDLLMQDEPIG